MKLYNASCQDILPSLSGEVDLVVTSPPYDDLRTYGLEETWSWAEFEAVAPPLVASLVQGGVLVWNVGDAVVGGSETGSSMRQALRFMELGLRLHDTMIWRKPNFSNPSSTRYHQVWEYMFVLSKGPPRVFNPLKDRPNVYAGKPGSYGRNTVTQRDGTKSERRRKLNTAFGMRHNVWDMRTSGQTKATKGHPATFPLELARDHILSWSNPGDVVMDPFAGTGTTGEACRFTHREFIGIEKSPAFFSAMEARLA